MDTRRLGHSALEIAPLVLGTNVMGWTADEPTSFAVLDAFVAEGFTAIDTADVYSRWVPGNDSESERIIGRWMKARQNRDRVHLFTKVGSDLGEGRKGLSSAYILQAVDASLARLQTDHIDLYQSHWPDSTVAQDETLDAYGKLIQAGKVRFIGASNYDEALLSKALRLSAVKGFPRYETLQNEYNLLERAKFEGPVQDLCVAQGVSLLCYFSLASGFLSGKYRSKDDLKQSQRGGSVEKYLDGRGLDVLAVMDEVSGESGASLSEIAVAWLNAQPGVGAPIASATSVAQLESLARGARLSLSPEQVSRLDAAGR